jgi:hypothetical protein
MSRPRRRCSRVGGVDWREVGASCVRVYVRYRTMRSTRRNNTRREYKVIRAPKTNTERTRMHPQSQITNSSSGGLRCARRGGDATE